MESLQLAQMLADLSSLKATAPQAANALVSANKDLSKNEPAKHLELPSTRPDLGRAASSTSVAGSRNASPGVKLDKYGRRILLSPPLSRTNSAQGSTPGTPRPVEAEDEVDRANTLMALYEIRTKLKQQDNSSLMKAREKIAALAAKQQAEVQGKSEQRVKHYPYTYPKS